MAERDAERENLKRAANGNPRRVEPLYTVADAADTVQRFVVHPYDEPVELASGVRVTFRDAGHILGSASVLLDLEEQGRRWRVLFSGDIGQFGSPILRDPVAHDAVDTVLMESTYGNRRHRDRAATVDELGAILQAARANGGNVLMPAFAVGRSQDLLYRARHALRRVAARRLADLSRQPTGDRGVEDLLVAPRALRRGCYRGATAHRDTAADPRICTLRARPRNRWRSTASPTAHS